MFTNVKSTIHVTKERKLGANWTLIKDQIKIYRWPKSRLHSNLKDPKSSPNQIKIRLNINLRVAIGRSTEVQSGLKKLFFAIHGLATMRMDVARSATGEGRWRCKGEHPSERQHWWMVPVVVLVLPVRHGPAMKVVAWSIVTREHPSDNGYGSSNKGRRQWWSASPVNDSNKEVGSNE